MQDHDQPQDALREKLRSEVMACAFEDLAPHLSRGALLLAEPTVDFLDVAYAIARDDRASVERFLQAAQLRRAGEPDQALFGALAEQRFQFVVVQPWVLAQPITVTPA